MLYKLIIILFMMFVPVCMAVAVPLFWVALIFTSFLWLASLPVSAVFCLLFASPFVTFGLYFWLKSFVYWEKELIKEFGEDRALWAAHVDPGSGGSPNIFFGKHMPKLAITRGWDLSADALVAFSNQVSAPAPIVDYARKGAFGLGSVLWSRFILRIDSILSWRFWAALNLFAYSSVVYCSFKRLTSYGVRLFWVYLSILLVLINTPSHKISFFFEGVLRLAWVICSSDSQNRQLFLEWVKWRVTVVVVTFTLAMDGLNHDVKARYSEQLSASTTRLIPLFREKVISFVKVVQDLSLPEFVRRRFSWQQSLPELEASRTLLADLGWPVNVDFATPDVSHEAGGDFSKWLIGGTDFRTGIFASQTYVESTLDTLRATALKYRRTEEYQNTRNEIESTSRYFKDRHVENMPLDVDMVWEVLGDIFARSRLTPFNVIIQAWEKKYALGFWFRDPHRNKKLKRKDFIASMGYRRFKELWARTFQFASLILPVAHVSVKGEPLPEKKWVHNKVRSIIGSPISQYILSTVFNFGPNHNFAWDTTPIKVGMPLNGFWMSKLFERHARFQIHVEGDFSDYDSTLVGPIITMIKRIRQRGYDYHSDRVRICELIDINYDQVINQVLGTTSTGNLWSKGTGLTTGHSSTSMDNSMALVTFYLMAWKQLTGKTAREFLHYNELSCFGDDHLLSIAHDRPRAWSPSNIRKIMATWGVVNNLEVKALQESSFLSKRCARPTWSLSNEMRSLGLSVPRFVVWHDKAKLVGKLVAKLKDNNPTYRAKRLISYLTLTAHHKDVYQSIVSALSDSKLAKSVLGSQMKIPTYRQVLVNWYSASPGSAIKEEDPDIDFYNNGSLLVYGTPTVFDQFLGALSQIPDLLNPSVFNFGISRSFQSKLATSMSWAVDLIILQNGASSSGSLSYFMRATPYSFIDPTIVFSGGNTSNVSTLLLRHWLFLSYVHFVKSWKGFAYFDFVISKLASAQFILNGIVQRDLPKTNLNIDRIMVVALLSFVHCPKYFDIAASIHFPDLPMFVDLIWNRVLSFFWQNVPATYSELTHLVSTKRWIHSPILVTAPTGTGKSTQMVYFLSQVTSLNAQKFVVIEPRSLLVSGLSAYMSSFMNLDCTAATTGSDFDPSRRVWYMTPQSFLANLHLMKTNFVYMVDECHLREPAYLVVSHLLKELKLNILMVTATPSDFNKRDAALVVDLPVASIWKVEDKRIPLPSTFDTSGYVNWALDYVNSCTPRARFMVLLDTHEACERFSKATNRSCQVVSRKSGAQPDPNFIGYACTSVVDVGITIPDVDVIIMPNWIYSGSNTRVPLDSASYRQRRGRVGRTRNGVAIVVETSVPTTPLPAEVFTRESYQQMLLSGVSPSVLGKLNPSLLMTSLGLDSALVDAADVPAVIRASGVFLRNLQPLLMATRSAEDGSLDIGPSSVITSTGAFNLSSRPSMSEAELSANALNATAAVLKRGLGFALSDQETQACARFVDMPGPIVRVSSLFDSLSRDLADGTSDLLNPSNRLPTGSLTDLNESRKIITLLRSISQIP